MRKLRTAIAAYLALLAGVAPCRAVELTISRQALERTLKQQLYSGPDGRYYLKGGPSLGLLYRHRGPAFEF